MVWIPHPLGWVRARAYRFGKGDGMGEPNESNIRIKTEDGYTFKLQEDGSWGDGDMSWPSLAEMLAALTKDGIKHWAKIVE